MDIRKPNRLKSWDYSGAGHYFVTLCTKGMEQLFWKDPTVGATCGRPLSRCGQLVQEELDSLSSVYPNVRLDKYVIMPNHIHMILHFLPPDGGRAQLAPTQTTHGANHFVGATCGRPHRDRETLDGRAQLAPTLSRVIQQFKGKVTKRIGQSVWQKSYHDHIIRDQADYLRIWRYIEENPAKWSEDCYYAP